MPLSPKEVAESLRKSKVGMFGIRENTDEVLEWALSGIPSAYRPFMTTALMVYHNTLLEVLAKHLESKDA